MKVKSRPGVSRYTRPFASLALPHLGRRGEKFRFGVFKRSPLSVASREFLRQRPGCAMDAQNCKSDEFELVHVRVTNFDEDRSG